MNIYEIETEESKRNPLSQAFSNFVVLAENFQEAYTKAELYCRKYTGIEVRSISKKYMIENI